MMKIIKHKYLLISIVFSVLSIVLLIVYSSAINKIPNNIIITAEIKKNIDNADAFIKPLEDSFSNLYIDEIDMKNLVQYENKHQPAAVHQIYGTYFESNYIKILSGREFYDSDFANSKYVLIDENLAFDFCGNYNCVGEQIQINGNEYIICGITSNPKGKYRISEYNVYLPLTTIENDSAVIVSVSSVGSGIQSARKAETIFSNYGKYYLFQTNIFKQRKLFWIYAAFSIYILILSVICTDWIKQIAKRVIQETREQLKTKYFSDIYLWVLSRWFFVIVCISAIVALLLLIFNKVSSLAWAYGEYIPKSLLDWESIRSAILSINIGSNLASPIKTIPQIQLESLNLYIYLIVMMLCFSVGFYFLWKTKNVQIIRRDKNES